MNEQENDPKKKDDKVITNPACPCWSGYHFMHRPTCGCTLCERDS